VIKMKVKILELFGGIGGLAYGIEKAVGKEKYEIAGYYDIDKYATAVFNYNFDTKYKPTDIRQVDESEIPKHNLLCAGFPCQPFSIAGKRRGFEDTRGTLFFEIARILEAKKPPYFILENVKGLLNHAKGKTFRIIIQALDELGYDLQWMVLNSKFFGVPQNRERVFIIGNLGGKPRPEILPFTENAREVQEVSGEEVGYETEDSKPEVGQAKGVYGVKGVYLPLNVGWTPIISPAITTENAHAYGNTVTCGQTLAILKCYKQHRTREWREHKECPTLTQNMGTGGNNVPMVIDRMLRRLTPIECERLQGFPDNWTKYGKFWNEKKRKWEVKEISDTQRYKMLGNAVTTNVVEWLFRLAFKDVFEDGGER